MIVNTTLNNQYYILKNSIETVIEYCIGTYDKIKSTIKQENQYEFLEKVDEKIKNIFEILFENEDILENELKCLIQIKPYIIYITGKNCEIPNFGYMNCTIYLLKIFKRLIDAKFQYLNDKSKLTHYNKVLLDYPDELIRFGQYFNENIFIKNNEFDMEIKKLNLKLQGR